jgi:GNS1/SUR4 family
MSGAVDQWYPSVADGSCVLEREGRNYEEIYCVYPWLKNFYMRYVACACVCLLINCVKRCLTVLSSVNEIYSNNPPRDIVQNLSWELTWRPELLYHWVQDNNWFPVACCVVYLIAIFWGQKYMEKREPYVMRKTLAAWNLALSIFSWWGLARLLPALIHNVYTYGFYSYLCMDPEFSIGPSATGMWGLFFVLSKPAELIDTFFIVAHKKKLLLLHWYHHVTVLLCTWYTFTTHCPPGLFYSTVNRE